MERTVLKAILITVLKWWLQLCVYLCVCSCSMWHFRFCRWLIDGWLTTALLCVCVCWILPCCLSPFTLSLSIFYCPLTFNDTSGPSSSHFLSQVITKSLADLSMTGHTTPTPVWPTPHLCGEPLTLLLVYNFTSTYQCSKSSNFHTGFSNGTEIL